MKSEQEKKLRRKIEDFLRKYASYEELVQIAYILGIEWAIEQKKEED